MEEGREYTGYWYTQNNPKNEVYGILTRSVENDIILKTHGILEKPDKLFNIMHSEPLGIINGYTSNGKHMTLIDNFNTGFTINAPGIPTSTYEPRYLIEGEQYKNVGDINFLSIEASYSYFNEWLGVSPLTCEMDFNKSSIFVRGESFLPIIYESDKLKIKINSRVKKKGDLLKNIELIHLVSVAFERNEGFSLAETFDTIHSFANFLTLCIGRRVIYLYIKSKDANDKGAKVYINGIERQKEREIDSRDVLVPYSYIKEDFGKYINNWFRKKDIMQPIVDYFVSLHDETFHIPMSFLKIVQALEAFSRRMRNNCIIDEEEHEEKILYILEKIDNVEYREWLKEEIEYSNEPKLRKRLNEIFKEVNFFININSKKRKRLVYDIVETRNYYTHFNESKKEKIMENDQIFYVSNLLIIILRVLIMKELGISEEVILKTKEQPNVSFIVKKALKD